VLESAVRSFSNLLERLHHSFWFYILVMPGKCLLVSVYILPVILLSIVLVLEGLKYWWASNLEPDAAKPKGGDADVLDAGKTKKLNGVLGKTVEKYYVMPQGYTRFDKEKREFVVPVGVLVFVHGAGGALMYLAEYMVCGLLFMDRMVLRLSSFRLYLHWLSRKSFYQELLVTSVISRLGIVMSRNVY
jgi:hypothetical protein